MPSYDWDTEGFNMIPGQSLREWTATEGGRTHKLTTDCTSTRVPGGRPVHGINEQQKRHQEKRKEKYETVPKQLHPPRPSHVPSTSSGRPRLTVLPRRTCQAHFTEAATEAQRVTHSGLQTQEAVGARLEAGSVHSDPCSLLTENVQETVRAGVNLSGLSDTGCWPSGRHGHEHHPPTAHREWHRDKEMLRHVRVAPGARRHCDCPLPTSLQGTTK